MERDGIMRCEHEQPAGHSSRRVKEAIQISPVPAPPPHSPGPHPSHSDIPNQADRQAGRQAEIRADEILHTTAAAGRQTVCTVGKNIHPMRPSEHAHAHAPPLVCRFRSPSLVLGGTQPARCLPYVHSPIVYERIPHVWIATQRATAPSVASLCVCRGVNFTSGRLHAQSAEHPRTVVLQLA